MAKENGVGRRSGWYAASDIEEIARHSSRPAIWVALGSAAVVASIVIAAIDGPSWRAVPAWLLALSGSAVGMLAGTVERMRLRQARGDYVRVDPTFIGWVMASVGLVLSIPRLIQIVAGSQEVHWSSWGLVIVGATQAGVGIAVLLTSTRVQPREGARPSHP
jgi:hypothetical protein